MTQITGAYAVAWEQVQLNGGPAPAQALAPGTVWQWQGDAIRLNGPSDVLVLETPCDTNDIRRRVAVKLGLDPAASEDDAPRDGFVLTDARRQWRGRIVARPGGGELCVFDGGLPPAGVPLWVVSDHRRAAPRVAHASGILAGTLVQTPDGPVAVETLFPGDLVCDGTGAAREALWVGRRSFSGAQIWATPDLAPVRILAGAFGPEQPERDILVAPGHHLALRSAAAQALFGTDQVLIRARDLLDGGGALRVMSGGDVTYVSVAFETHGGLDVAGVSVESFHPVTHGPQAAARDDMGRLAAILPETTGDPADFGPTAARCLSAAEAAILLGS